MKLSCFGQTQTQTHKEEEEEEKRREKKTQGSRTCADWQTTITIFLQLATSCDVSFSRLVVLGPSYFPFLICIFNLIRMRLYAVQQSLCPCGCSSCKLKTHTKKKKKCSLMFGPEEYEKKKIFVSSPPRRSELIYICLILDL